MAPVETNSIVCFLDSSTLDLTVALEELGEVKVCELAAIRLWREFLHENCRDVVWIFDFGFLAFFFFWDFFLIVVFFDLRLLLFFGLKFFVFSAQFGVDCNLLRKRLFECVYAVVIVWVHDLQFARRAEQLAVLALLDVCFQGFSCWHVPGVATALVWACKVQTLAGFSVLSCLSVFEGHVTVLTFEHEPLDHLL